MKINKTSTWLNLTTAALGCVGSMVATAPMAKAVNISIYDPINSGITSLNFSVSGTTITINETWGSSNNGFLLFDGLIDNQNYTVIKNITNQTGDNWTRLANELLDPNNGSGSNDDFDFLPYPSFVPPGFTTSNDQDGLSFAQGSGIPRQSDIWSNLIVDESSDVRDFLDFFDGNLANGGSGFVTYGLRDSNPNDNEPFLLSQRPNQMSQPPNPTSTPEPSAIIGLLAVSGLGIASKLKKKS